MHESLYRPNVATLLLNAEGRLLICERKDYRGSWQFPQGGVDEGETLLDALHRELEEEVGLHPDHYDVIDQRGGYRYEFPGTKGGTRGAFRNYIGQEQTYFRCRLHVPDSTIRLDAHQPVEFAAWRWINPAEFELKWLPFFKRPVYDAVIRDFFGVRAIPAPRRPKKPGSEAP